MKYFLKNSPKVARTVDSYDEKELIGPIENPFRPELGL